MIVLNDAFRFGDGFGTVSIGFGVTAKLAKHDACLLALSVLLVVDYNKVLFGDGCRDPLGMDQAGQVELSRALELWREKRPVIATPTPEKKRTTPPVNITVNTDKSGVPMVLDFNKKTQRVFSRLMTPSPSHHIYEKPSSRNDAMTGFDFQSSWFFSPSHDFAPGLLETAGMRG
jgi:hypothetical protein